MNTTRTYPTQAGRLVNNSRVTIRLNNGADTLAVISPTRGSDDHVDVTIPGMGVWTVPVDRKVEVVHTQCAIDGCYNTGRPYRCDECSVESARRTAEAWAVMRMSF